MRFAGDQFNTRIENGVKTYMLDQGNRENYDFYQLGQDRPVVPGFNTEDLAPTPEITPPNRPTFMPGQAAPMDLLKDKYIRENPGSGVAKIGNKGQEIAGLFNPFDWINGNNQKDIEKMDSGSKEDITNHGKIGNTLMNRNRILQQIRNEM